MRKNEAPEHQKWENASQKTPKDSQLERVAQGEQKSAKGSQKEAKEPNGAKRSQKRAKRAPKCIPKSINERSPKKVTNRGAIVL